MYFVHQLVCQFVTNVFQSFFLHCCRSWFLLVFRSFFFFYIYADSCRSWFLMANCSWSVWRRGWGKRSNNLNFLYSYVLYVFTNSFKGQWKVFLEFHLLVGDWSNVLGIAWSKLSDSLYCCNFVYIIRYIQHSYTYSLTIKHVFVQI